MTKNKLFEKKGLLVVNLKEKQPIIVKNFVGGECFKKVIVTEAKDF